MRNRSTKGLFKSKAASDIALNMVSMVVVGASGLLYTSIIALFHSPDILGLFNTAYAYYIVFSQVSVMGIHFSVLKYTSEYSNDNLKLKKIYTAAMLGTLLTSILFSSILFVLFRIISLYYTDKVLKALNLLLPALVFFSLNKVLLNYLKGLMEMKLFAFYYAFRYILLILSIIILTAFDINGIYLACSFFFSELILFIVIIIHLKIKKMVHYSFSKAWLKEHLRYGSCIFMGNLVLDLNTRIDVIILSFFTSQRIIGIYSFALVFSEGFYQTLMVARRHINPLITRYYKNDRQSLDKLKTFISKEIKMYVLILCILVLVAFGGLNILLEQSYYFEGAMPLLLLVLSISINSRAIVFGNLMSQTGFPKQETIINIFTILANILGNFILVPLYGMMGAAISTSLSYFVFSLALKHYCRRKINISI